MGKRLAIHALVALATSCALTGCFTTLGAVVGGVVANTQNQSAGWATGSAGPHHSVTTWTLAGGGIGFALDVLLLALVIEDQKGTQGGGF
jgi:hypothetical protein